MDKLAGGHWKENKLNASDEYASRRVLVACLLVVAGMLVVSPLIVLPISICLVAFCASFVGCLLLLAWLVGLQSVKVFVPVPPGASLEAARLMLDEPDAMVYKYLMAHKFRIRSRDNGCVFHYWDKPIYNARRGLFEVDGTTIKAQKIKVLARSALLHTSRTHRRFCMRSKTARSPSCTCW